MDVVVDLCCCKEQITAQHAGVQLHVAFHNQQKFRKIHAEPNVVARASGIANLCCIEALITIPVLLAFWFVGHMQSMQSSVLLRDLFSDLSFAQHFADFIQGLIRSEAVAFFLVVSAIALTLNTSYLQWRR